MKVSKLKSSGFIDTPYVSWKIFVWIIGIIFVIFGTAFNLIIRNSGKLDAFNQDSIQIRVQLSQIQADLVWIKANLNN